MLLKDSLFPIQPSVSSFLEDPVNCCYSMLQTGILKANDGVAKSDGGDVGGTWLQLTCCALPKHLCP